MSKVQPLIAPRRQLHGSESGDSLICFRLVSHQSYEGVASGVRSTVGAYEAKTHLYELLEKVE